MAEPEKEHTSECCPTPDPRIALHFDKRTAGLIADGELPEMVDVSEMLLALLDDVEKKRPTLLELGCGSGALTVELLERGATRAVGIDLSPAALAAARQRAEEAGVAERVTFKEGDGALAELEPHDWVVLDRVICCYPDFERLLGNATRAATHRLAFSAPTSRGWRGMVNRVGWAIENIPARLRRTACPTFVHDLDRMEAIVAQAGFERRSHTRQGLWYAAVWERH